VTVLERGWLSSNNILLDDGEQQASLVDSGHSRHAAQTVALVRQALRGRRLGRLFNTHLHSDHCGGNAALQAAFGCRLFTPLGNHAAARAWDQQGLNHLATGQLCERFVPDESFAAGATLAIGARRWQVMASPGHDPHAVMLFDAAAGLLISADALWENGFGLIFPELEGVDAFGDQAAVLDLIEDLDARWVIPGHGSPFGDVPGALARARQRLAGYQADPARHARHAARVMVKYHLMEVGQQAWADYCDWFCAAPLQQAIWERAGHPEGSPRAYAERVAHDLVAQGALRAEDGQLHDTA
jgi:glyoxylase-like metal-dependent hydrolase (beta-lactamase superfamily II)